MIKRIIAVSAALAMITTWAEAQEVKVGVNLPYTGIGAEFAQLVDRGMELYLKLNADKVKPYKITLIKRDVKDPGGANAKIAVQELLTQDNVDILAGWIYSPKRDRVGPDRHRRQEARRDHERGHSAHYQLVALLRPNLVQHVACRLCHGRSRGQDPEREDRGGRL